MKSPNVQNHNQPKYASAISGGDAEEVVPSLESRYDSKKVDTPQDDSGKANVADNEDNGHGTFPVGLNSQKTKICRNCETKSEESFHGYLDSGTK